MEPLNELALFWTLFPLGAVALAKSKRQEAILEGATLFLSTVVLGIFLWQHGPGGVAVNQFLIAATLLTGAIAFVSKEDIQIRPLLGVVFLIYGISAPSFPIKILCILVCDLLTIAEYFKKTSKSADSIRMVWGSIFCLAPVGLSFVSTMTPADIAIVSAITIVFRAISWPINSWTVTLIKGGGANAATTLAIPALIIWNTAGAGGEAYWPTVFFLLAGAFSLGGQIVLSVILAAIPLLSQGPSLSLLAVASPFVILALDAPFIVAAFLLLSLGLTAELVTRQMAPEISYVTVLFVGLLIGRAFIRKEFIKKPDIKQGGAIVAGVGISLYALITADPSAIMPKIETFFFWGGAVAIFVIGVPVWKSKSISKILVGKEFFKGFVDRISTNSIVAVNMVDFKIPDSTRAGRAIEVFDTEKWAYLGLGLLGVALLWSLL